MISSATLARVRPRAIWAAYALCVTGSGRRPSITWYSASTNRAFPVFTPTDMPELPSGPPAVDRKIDLLITNPFAIVRIGVTAAAAASTTGVVTVLLLLSGLLSGVLAL